MTKVYGTGAYDFKRHRVAEYPVDSTTQVTDPKTGSALPNSITLLEIQRDRLTKIAEANWSKAGDGSKPIKPFDPNLVKEIYETELVVLGGRKTVPLQRVMILEVSQYLENYLWPNFDPETVSFEHVMSMILMVNEKFRENVAAWVCFYDRKDVFKAFIEKVLRLKEQGRSLRIAEKTNYLLFMINAFQSLEDEIVSETVLSLASLQSWLSLSYGRFQMELCLNTDLIKKWKRMIKREAKEVMKRGEPFDPSTMLEAKFLRNIIEEFLEVLDSKVFSYSHGDDEDNELVDANGFEKVNDACILYCERFMEFLIDLLSQLPTRSQIHWHGCLGKSICAWSFVPNELIKCLQTLSLQNGFSKPLLSSPPSNLNPPLNSNPLPWLKRKPLEDINSYLLQLGLIRTPRALNPHLAHEVEFSMEHGPPSKKIGCFYLLPSDKGHEIFVSKIYLRPIVSDVAVVAKCHLSALYTHEKGKLFAQLVDLLQFYEGFEINDHVGTQLNDDEVLQSHYDRLQSFQLLAFKKIPKLRELALANIGGIHRRADLSKRLSVLSPEELKDLVCCKLKLVSREDPWSERVDFLIEVMVSFFEKQQSQKEAINALPLYPNEQIMWDESLVPSINYSGEGCLALPKLNLQFLTLHDYLLRNFNLFRLESTYEIREDIQEAPSSVTAEEGTLMNDFSGRIKRDEWKPPKGELRTVTVALDTAQYHMDVSDIAEKDAEDVDLMNETCIVPDWLHNIFLGYGNPSAAQWTNMPDLLETVDFKDTFLDVDHLRECFSDYQVQFINSDGTENLHPRPPFRIRLPRMLKGNIHALPGNKKSSTASMNDVSKADDGSEREKLIVEAYIPPDPGPYPQDQPKQNSVRFTPTQIGAISSGIQPGLTMVVGPPGTGKTDTAVQILNVLYHNCPSQRTLIITHSNQALNDLFEKIMQRDVPARYLLRLGQGEQELATDLDFSRQGRVNAMLVRRLELLSEVERLARSLQLPEDVGYTCETAGYFWLLHVYSHWEQFLAACSGNEDKPTFVQDHMRAAKGCFRHLKTMFQELEECRAFELLKSTADRANYLMTKQAKIVAMTCTHAALKRKDFLQLGFKYDNLLMEESAQILEIETFIPMLLQRQEDGPSIAQLYNWRYRELGDLPYVKEADIFHKANAGFSYDYQLVDVPDYLGKGETAPSPWFYQNEGEAEYVVSVYMYMRLLGYPASKISILTTYNGQKLLIRDVINRRCVPYDFIGPPSKVTTVDKFQGQQNDFILLSLVRTRFVGHLRDVRRLVVAMSRARLGLYVFCRRFLFEQCYELQPTFQLLLQRPDHLALNLNETTSFTDRHVADPGLVQLVSSVEEMSGIVNFKMHQVYQARVMGHQFDQFSAYSGQVAPSLGGWEEQKSQRDSTSQHQPMGTDMPANSHDANGILPPESKPEEATEMEVLENGQDGDLSPENNLKENTDMDGDRGAPLQNRSIDENKME
ncbi:unnamed protein product, partial [Vitis vinifera]